MASRLLRAIGLSPKHLAAGDESLFTVRRLGVDFKSTFDNWQQSASDSYARRELQADPDGFRASCQKEVERIVGLALPAYLAPDGKSRLQRTTYSFDKGDAQVAIVLHGTGLRGQYQGRDRSGSALTGARVSGAISLQLGDHPQVSKRFSGMIQPPSSVPDYKAWGGPPFVAAVSDSDFEKKLRSLLAEYFEPV